MSERPSWEKYFMDIAILVSSRSTCLRRQVGAVAVIDKRIVATGYNGQMIGAKHCVTCLREEMGVPSGERHELCKALHAEENIITQCAKNGVSMCNSTIYCCTKPCSGCFKKLVNSGVTKIVYKNDYKDVIVDTLIEDAGFMYSFDKENGYYNIIKK